jgi:cytoskeletal protein CcmA (bactofilin family)
MSIANIKSKLATAANGGVEGEKSITRKLEMLSSSNFKTTPTIIARDMTIEGNLHSTGVIEIEGNVKGIVKSESIILREECFVEGSIISENLNIRGRFEGSIKAKNISISSKGRVHGEIEYDSLSVEDGASIDGQFKRLNASSK